MAKKPPTGERTPVECIADALERSTEKYPLKYPLGTLPLPVEELEAIRVHLEWWASQQKELDNSTLGEYSDALVETVAKQIGEELQDPIDSIANGPVDGALGEYLKEGKDSLFLATSTAIAQSSRQFAAGAEAIHRSATDKTAKAEALRALAGSIRRGLYHDYPEEIRFYRTSDQEAEAKAVDGLVAPVLARLLLKQEALLESQAQFTVDPPEKPPRANYPKGDDRWLRGVKDELLDKVNFQKAEGYLGIKPRQRQKLIESEKLVLDGARFITVKSLLGRLAPTVHEKNPH